LTEDVFEEEIEIGNADDEEDDEEDYAIENEYEEGKTSFGYPLSCSHHNNIYSHNMSYSQRNMKKKNSMTETRILKRKKKKLMLLMELLISGQHMMPLTRNL
jgi:hypothetical protein